MGKSFKELAWKCFQNGLDFRTMHFSDNKTIRITDYVEDELVVISDYIVNASWIEEPSEIVFEKMHQEVDAYLNRISVPFMDEHETEHAQAVLTEQERKMKEAGHTEKDFL